MADAPWNNTDRLDELLALREVGNLSLDEQAELDELLAGAQHAEHYDDLAGRLIVLLDDESNGRDSIPSALAAALTREGEETVGNRGRGRRDTPMPLRSPKRSWIAATGWAAAAAIAVSTGIGLFMLASQLNRERDARGAAIAEAKLQVVENARIIEASRTREATLRNDLSGLESELRTAQLALADEQSQRIELANRLAKTSAALDAAELRIASFEVPVDPTEIRENRRKLLDVPGTIRLAWQPFDLPDAPAEQQAVTGDVVWNDDLEQGYLRFVGLAPNNPSVEQYQVWVIDERGLEQKVSGGVFNADAEGEIIVPIDPAIDVGRVALFAITVEEPGGTWVPDLTRRVVVAQPAG
ncbi:MAG: anti-sigma factor [Planctomycetota bacterium]